MTYDNVTVNDLRMIVVVRWSGYVEFARLAHPPRPAPCPPRDQHIDRDADQTAADEHGDPEQHKGSGGHHRPRLPRPRGKRRRQNRRSRLVIIGLAVHVRAVGAVRMALGAVWAGVESL